MERQSLVVTLKELKDAVQFLENWQIVKNEKEQYGEDGTMIHIVRLPGDERLIFKVIHG